MVAALPSNLEAKTINLATRTDASGSEFFVGICARPSPTGTLLGGKPGHMFVSFSEKYSAGGHDFVALGHTTDSGASAAMTFIGGSVDGAIREEVYTHIHQECLVVQLNREDFESAKSVVVFGQDLAELIGSKGAIPILEDYRLGSEDCMAFAIDVARQIQPLGLVVPDRITDELPMTYMQRLISEN